MTGDLKDVDYAKIEERILASMVGDLPDSPEFDWQRDLLEMIQNPRVKVGVDPAGKDQDTTVVICGRNAEFFIVDEMKFLVTSGDLDFIHSDDAGRRFFPIGEQTISGTLVAEFVDEEALRRLTEPKPIQPEEFRPNNRKQRRIDEAKARHKRSRGQRKRMVFDIESDAYDPNRVKDWQR